MEASLKGAAIICITLLFGGCSAIHGTEGIPPVVFTDEGPLTRVPGKIGVLHQDLEVNTAVLTNGQLFKKEIWSKMAQGSSASFAWYQQTFHPMEFVNKECGKSNNRCRDAQVAVGALALVAMAVGGVVGGLDAEYSEALEGDLKEGLVQQVQGVSDQLQKSILPSANALLFEQARESDKSESWTRQAFAALESRPLIDMLAPGDHMKEAPGDMPSPPQENDLGSFLQASITRIHFTDDDRWLSSGVELRVEALARVTAVSAAVSDEKQYECVSVPRPLRFWTVDSYRHVREEILFCAHLLGRQIAGDLLGVSIRTSTR